MVKNFIALVFIVGFVVTGTVSAQQSRYFVHPTGNQPAEVAAPAPVETKQKRQRQSVAAPAPAQVPTEQRTIRFNETPSVEPTSTSSLLSQYQALQYEREVLLARIDGIKIGLEGASKTTTQILNRNLKLEEAALRVVDQKMAAFPAHIKQGMRSVPMTQHDEQFNQQLQEIVNLRISRTNPYGGLISNDPQLERIYRDYLASEAEAQLTQDGRPVSHQGVRYMVMIAISQNPIQAQQFEPMIDLFEQKLDNGATIYYQGSYASLSEAQTACDNIITHTRFKDSFVVAMRGNRRIALPGSQYNF